MIFGVSEPAVFLLVLFGWAGLGDALSKGAECPKVSYRKDTYGNTWPMTSFIYCDTGCCGSRDNQDCCDEDKDNRTGLYVGVVAASLVLIVATISVTCCFVHRYNRKNVVVGINAGTHYQMQPQIAQYSYPTAPPLYEQAVATGHVLSKGAECPKVSYRKDTYGNTWPMTSFIYCDTGCCGSRDNQDCCDEDKDNRTGLYVGVVAASLVLIVATISVTCCIVHRYNRKNVMVGINAGTHYQMQPQIAQYSYPTAPPLYEQAVATGDDFN
uniref:Uncharacterized protein n=1 Tax=Magallana gigas TaxID=29159 RepID=K1PPQ8_MAGGI